MLTNRSQWLFLIPVITILCCRSREDSYEKQPVADRKYNAVLPCDQCSGGAKAVMVHQFSNGASVKVCGSLEENEFFIYDCSNERQLIQPADFYTKRLIVLPDTLVIEEYTMLPTGKNWSRELWAFRTRRIVAKDGKVVLLPSEINPEIRVDKARVAETLKLYDFLYAHKDSLNSEWGLDSYSRLIERLTVCILSGDTSAANAFNSIESSFRLDGAFAEDYHEAVSILKGE